MYFSSTPFSEHPFISNIIVIEFNQDFPGIKFNDFGYSYLQFGYGKTEAYNCNNQLIKTPDCSIKSSGSFWNINAFENTRWVFIELPTSAFYKLTGIETHIGADNFHDYSSFENSETIKLVWSTLKEVNDPEKISTLITKQFNSIGEKLNEELEVDKLVSLIFQKNGLLSIQDLEMNFNGSRRTLERTFKTYVGHSPSKFIRLVRFNYIIREIEAQSASIEELVHQYDYYDRSHFEKDFQTFYGCRITEFKSLLNPVLTESLQRAYGLQSS